MTRRRRTFTHTRDTPVSFSLSVWPPLLLLLVPLPDLFMHTPHVVLGGDLRSKIMSTLINKLSHQTTEKKFSALAAVVESNPYGARCSSFNTAATSCDHPKFISDTQLLISSLYHNRCSFMSLLSLAFDPGSSCRCRHSRDLIANLNLVRATHKALKQMFKNSQ